MKKILPIILLALYFTSCEDKIDLDVPNGPDKLVVDGLLSNADSLQLITLSSTSPYFESSRTPRISGAKVYVTTSNDSTIDFVEDSIPGEYKAIYELKDSTITFQLHIITKEGNEYMSYEEKMNRVAPVDSLIQSEEIEPARGDFREEGYTGLLTTKEYKGRGDYYRWIILINDEKLIDPFNLIITDDNLVDGNVIKDWDIVAELKPGDFVEIHQMSISERAYHYWNLIFNQITKFGGPFDTPPAPIEGNVFNINDKDEQVLGFFGVSKVEKATLLVVDK